MDARRTTPELSLAGTLRLALAHIGDRLLAWPRRQRLLAELNALSPRELADIGLTRGDFARVLDMPVAPRPAAPAPSRARLGKGAALPA
ncbi:DUF1127 domain-containing protein [Siccirubricoccus sp. G192]|uniref:DUF1127 domain-containing protein n=1 Tax=Siccirubricoccus sp. G192 TaxID=2849651 RepID=UPI001C2C458E|nr:DUF1127 domain-containing protein [Siccirubricoccus sp. G192]MBV1797105.1 DUF1127 domain-containing protein [Siccirubricoccus sp. G192]